MIVYSLIFVLSIGGVLAMLRRQRQEFGQLTFADFMENLLGEIREIWETRLRDKFYLFLEKRLRGIRIIFLRVETKLSRALARLRGIKEKNGNGGGGGNGVH